MHKSILFLYAKIIAETCSAMFEKYGRMTREVKTSDMPYRKANPSIVSTSISLIALMLMVIANSQTRPDLKVMCTSS